VEFTTRCMGDWLVINEKHAMVVVLLLDGCAMSVKPRDFTRSV